MEKILQEPELMKTAFMGVASFLVALYSAAGERKYHFVMTISLVATLICVLLVWFKVMGGALL